MNYLSRDSAATDEALTAELNSLHDLMMKDPLYTSMDGLKGVAMVILSSREPHLILHCSEVMEDMTGVDSKNLFGLSLSSVTTVESDNYVVKASVA